MDHLPPVSVCTTYPLYQCGPPTPYLFCLFVHMYTLACNWQQPFLNDSAEWRRVIVENISWSISTKVWDQAGIKLATPGSAVRLASVARHITDCATRPGPTPYISVNYLPPYISVDHLPPISVWTTYPYISVDRLAGVYTSIKSTKIKIIPYNSNFGTKQHIL